MNTYLFNPQTNQIHRYSKHLNGEAYSVVVEPESALRLLMLFDAEAWSQSLAAELREALSQHQDYWSEAA